MRFRPDVLSLSTVLALFGSIGCSKSPEVSTVSSGLVETPIGTSIAVGVATPSECPTGGVAVKTFRDANRNGVLDAGEEVLTATPVCNGSNGSAGVGAGIRVSAAPSASCPAGGTQLTTFRDLDSDGVQDVGETATSVSTICNGVGSVLTASAASSAQCPSGGTVYAIRTEGQAPSASIVCNGVNGTDGTDAGIRIEPVGPAVPGRPFSACHHDALYVANAGDPSRGWLIFRHQQNGANDQGIGQTGFNLWNVDISDFALVSETKKVTYCRLRWSAKERRLDYEVIEEEFGFAGKSGSLQF